ncbi:tetratricopeptide repeat protein [Kineococcus indalonis]|uniref:tetratricopeptide repeat protein n=1 Tax=Kineococcus indalonis TaxID=2696566 RepID=UPI001412A657|nr:tetratricopeptide repeat protein [Kineococcus indalonis]NAZ85409.1 Replicase polyprotein 1ab [Kineococcus indalonis]
MRRSLSGLPAESVDLVARHLVASGQLVDVDPERAWQHALAAQRRGGRIAAVREAAAIAAYKAGHFREALAEFRTARRMTGDDSYLPLMADCERGLGRPERALDLASSPETANLEPAAKVEMLIVAAGARHDLGQHDAAVVALQVPQLRAAGRAPWRARLWYAYADALLTVGREDEAREWLEKAADADTEGETDAAERLSELEGVVFEEEYLDEEEIDALIAREEERLGVRAPGSAVDENSAVDEDSEELDGSEEPGDGQPQDALPVDEQPVDEQPVDELGDGAAPAGGRGEED